MNRVGLTDKRLSDRRFRRTEEAILEAFFEGNNYISINEMAQKVGVTRATFYNHHRTVGEIVSDYNRYTLRKYAVSMGRYLRKNKRASIEVIYRRILGFIIMNRGIFLIFSKVNDRVVFTRMIDLIGPTIARKIVLPRNSKKIYRVYNSEVVEILSNWGKNGYLEEEMEGTLKDIVYLSRTARARLKGLLDKHN